VAVLQALVFLSWLQSAGPVPTPAALATCNFHRQRFQLAGVYTVHVPSRVLLIACGVCCASLAGWVLFAFCTFWCCALLMPINGTAGFLVSWMQQQLPNSKTIATAAGLSAQQLQ
jgi:hypothetical protein